jgi:hypothetical protein
VRDVLANFLRISTLRLLVKLYFFRSRLKKPKADMHSRSAKYKKHRNARKTSAEHLALGKSQINCSGLGLDFRFSLRLRLETDIKRLDCAPSYLANCSLFIRAKVRSSVSLLLTKSTLLFVSVQAFMLSTSFLAVCLFATS